MIKRLLAILLAILLFYSPVYAEDEVDSKKSKHNVEEELLFAKDEKSKAGEGEEKENPGGTKSFIELFFWLGIVILLICLSVFLFKKFVPGSKKFFSNPAVKILGRTYLAPKHSIFLVKVAGKVLVLGVSPDSVRTLTTIRKQEEIDNLNSQLTELPTKSFANSFKKIFKKSDLEFENPKLNEEGHEEKTERFRKIKKELENIKNIVTSWKS